MAYIDGFVLAVPAANREVYREHATRMAQAMKGLGATQCIEACGDDVPEGKVTSFPMAVQRKADEAVVFSWVWWPDKATRDGACKTIMADPAMSAMDMPFDGKRVILGGFEVLVEV